MSARKATKKAKSRPPRHGLGNPVWNRAYVTASHRQNFRPDEFFKTAPISLSAGPAVGPNRVRDRIKVTVSQGYADPFRLQVEGADGPSAHVFDQGVTLAQLYSFEEAVRAVFRAAREEGLLPPMGEAS